VLNGNVFLPLFNTGFAAVLVLEAVALLSGLDFVIQQIATVALLPQVVEKNGPEDFPITGVNRGRLETLSAVKVSTVVVIF
jgi:hypothetical protein